MNKSIVIGDGLPGLITAYLSNSKCSPSGYEVPSSKTPFSLGPLILEYSSDKVKQFVDSVCPGNEPENFIVGYMLPKSRILNEPTPEVMDNYKKLTNHFEGALNNGKNLLYGWDIKKIGLKEKLNKIVTKIDYVNSDKYSDIYYTLPYYFLDSKYEKVFRDKYFKAYYCDEIPKDFSFIYVCYNNKHTINRITKIQPGLYVLEGRKELPDTIRLGSYYFHAIWDNIKVPKMDIIQNFNFEHFGKYRLVGRVAKVNKVLKLNHIIEEFSR